jgi:hypothetical protein
VGGEQALDRLLTFKPIPVATREHFDLDGAIGEELDFPARTGTAISTAMVSSRKWPIV